MSHTIDTLIQQMKLREMNLMNFPVLQSFKTAQVVPRNGHKILETMAGELETMFRLKIGAVEVKRNSFYFCV